MYASRTPVPLCQHALGLARRGFAVFPLAAGSKRPIVKDWPAEAGTDPRRIAAWWREYPRSNIGIACGPSHLYVIDLDAPKRPGDAEHGRQRLAALAAGRALPATYTVASARGGWHLYFRPPAGSELRNTNGHDPTGLGPMIDTRGVGGYVVGPGSVFEGRPYRVHVDAPIAPLPGWLHDELTARLPRAAPAPVPFPTRPVPAWRRSAYGAAALRRAAAIVAHTPEGARNHTLYRQAYGLGRLVSGGILDRDHTAAVLQFAAETAGLPPREAAAAIASGLTRSATRPRRIA